MFRSPSISEHHLIQTETGSRKLAYTVTGDLSAAKVFLCLPGLLETRANFEPLLAMAQSHENCCWISLDYCGRGDSDPLDPSMNYAMSVYLADIEVFLAESVFTKKPVTRKKFFLVGTSMGGILAMQLAKKLGKKIHGLILNDVSLSLHWSSLYGLYTQFDMVKKNKGFSAEALGVEPRAVKDVQSPAHFDLHYEFDLLGMHFHQLMKGFDGPVLLVHNSHSNLCPTEIAQQTKRHVPHIKIFTVQGQSHPVDWSSEVCEWISQAVGLKEVNCVGPVPELHEKQEPTPAAAADKESCAVVVVSIPQPETTPQEFQWLKSPWAQLKNTLKLSRIFRLQKN